MTGKIRIYLEMSGNVATTYQNLWDKVKAVLRGNFIAVNAYVKKQERSQVDNLPSQLTEGEEQTNQSDQKKGNNNQNGDE